MSSIPNYSATSSSSSSSSTSPGYCMFQWNGTVWQLLTAGPACSVGYHETPPAGPGNHPGEQRMGTCTPTI